MQTTLTRIFIDLKSVSNGLSKFETKCLEKIENSNVFFRQKLGDLQKKKKKKRSSSKFKAIFLPKFRKFKRFRGGSFRMGGAIFNFSRKIGLKSTKNMRFCILHKPMGGARAPPAPPPGYATVCYAYSEINPIILASSFSNWVLEELCRSVQYTAVELNLILNIYVRSWTALFRAFSSHRQPSASLTKLFPSCCGFLLQNYEKQTEHNMSQLFSMLINFYSLIKGIPQLDKTLVRLLAELDKP